MQTLTRSDALAAIPDQWIQLTLADPKAGEYPKRFAQRLHADRASR